MPPMPSRQALIEERVRAVGTYVRYLTQYAQRNTLLDDEVAKEALARALLEMDGIRKILEAPVLAAERYDAKTTSTIPAEC